MTVVETPSLGSRVVDRDADDSDADRARVIAHPDGVASEVWIEAVENTVAGANPDYPADAAVVTVAFEPALDDTLPDGWRAWTPKGLAAAVAEADVTTYDYPAPRLREVGDRA